MRKLRLALPLFLIALLPYAVSGQNGLFIPFGQTESEVKNFIKSRSYVQIAESDSESRILKATSDIQEASYEFHNNSLCVISNKRTYRDKKEAERIIKSCLAYLSRGERKVATLPSKNFVKHYACMERGRIVELRINQFNDEGGPLVIIELVAMSTKFSPSSEVAAYASLIEENL